MQDFFMYVHPDSGDIKAVKKRLVASGILVRRFLGTVSRFNSASRNGNSTHHTFFVRGCGN